MNFIHPRDIKTKNRVAKFSLGAAGDITQTIEFDFARDIAPYLIGNTSRDDTLDMGTVGALNKFKDDYFQTNTSDFSNDRANSQLGRDSDRYGDSFGSGHPASKNTHKAHVQMAAMVAYWLYEFYKYNNHKNVTYLSEILLGYDLNTEESNWHPSIRMLISQLQANYFSHGQWRANTNKKNGTDYGNKGEAFVLEQLRLVAGGSAKIAAWLMLRMNYSQNKDFKYYLLNTPQTIFALNKPLVNFLPNSISDYKINSNYLAVGYSSLGGQVLQQGTSIYLAEENMDDIDGFDIFEACQELSEGLVGCIPLSSFPGGDTTFGVTTKTFNDWKTFVKKDSRYQLASSCESGIPIWANLHLIASYGTYCLYGKKEAPDKATYDSLRILVDAFDVDLLDSAVGFGSAGYDIPTQGPNLQIITPAPAVPVFQMLQTSLQSILSRIVNPTKKAVVEEANKPVDPNAEFPSKRSRHEGNPYAPKDEAPPSSDNKGVIAVMALLAVGVLGLLAYRKQSK